MNTMRLYKIETNLNGQQNSELLKNMSEEDSKYLTSLYFPVSVDLVNENGLIDTFLVANTINLEKLKRYFVEKNISVGIEDVTEFFTQEKDEQQLNKFFEALTSEDILKVLGVEI